MEEIVLKKRILKGKKCKSLLGEGSLPCVIYNARGDSTNCQIDYIDGEKLLRGVTSATMLDIIYEKQKKKVLVKDIDINPKTDSLRHIAFFEIDESVESVFEIPFVFVEVAPAVKNNIGVLIQTTNSIEVKCKSKDLVPQIDVDISSLENIGDSILVKDIEIPKGLKLIDEEEQQNYTVATITEIQKEIEVEEDEIEEGEESEAGETGATTEEETEGEKDERTEEKEE